MKDVDIKNSLFFIYYITGLLLPIIWDYSGAKSFESTDARVSVIDTVLIINVCPSIEVVLGNMQIEAVLVGLVTMTEDQNVGHSFKSVKVLKLNVHMFGAILLFLNIHFTRNYFVSV